LTSEVAKEHASIRIFKAHVLKINKNTDKKKGSELL
jgi:hypothetical protein